MLDAALSWATPVGAWLLTYLVHSTILIGIVWLAARWLERRPGVADKLWKAALVGGLITASVQVGVGIQPMAGSVALGETPTSETATAPTNVDVVVRPSNQAPRTRTDGDQATSTNAEIALWLSAGEKQASESSTGALAIAVACWLGLAMAFLALILSTWVRLRRRLHGRREIVAGPLRETLSRLTKEAGYRRTIRLTASYDIDVPIAIGIWRREICLPERALYRLNQDQRDTMLAHELAHLLRGDPEWRIAALSVRTLLFVQPLNRVASRGMEQVSEDLCDDWAVERTSQPLALARCLTEVAEWLKAGPQLLGSIPAMASHGSGLGRRVRRLVAKTTGAANTRRALWVTPAILAILPVLVFAAPGVRPAHADADDDADVAAVSVTPMPAPAKKSIPAPSEDSVRSLVANLFPKAHGKRRVSPSPPPTMWAPPSPPTLPAFPSPQALNTLLKSIPGNDVLEDLIEKALEDVLGGDIEIELELDFDLDDRPSAIDIHIDGPNFDIEISLPDVEVKLDIPDLGMLNGVIEDQLENALRGLIQTSNHRAERKQRKAERKLRKRWRKHRRKHKRQDHDCNLSSNPFPFQ